MAARALPHPEIRVLAEANTEQLDHFRADLYWTISTDHGRYRYATYHSPLGAAIMEIGNFENEECRLTNRQLQVVTLGAIGLGVKQISKQLHLTDNTVKAHRTRASEPLGIPRKYGPSVEPSIVACFEGKELNIVRPLPRRPNRLCSPLTQKILEAVGHGATNSEIALELGCDELQVRYRRHIAYGADHVIRTAAEAITLLYLSPPDPQAWPHASTGADTALE